ncbi:MAG: T9SS type A sorting domain-containing protein [Ignavibacteriae bacterium]|nr:T9SS type A sorting domain-containing protein [Ignavibacteriota bacterium]
MKHLNRRRILALGFWILVVVLRVVAQHRQVPVEKEGRIGLPDLRYLTSHALVMDAYEGPQPFDMLHYKLDITLPMTSDALAGRCFMKMKLKRNVDSLVLNSVGLALDTVRVDGVAKSAQLDSLTETFTIPLNETRHAGDTLLIDIAYHRLQNFRRTSSRQGFYFFRDTIGLPANLGYTFSEPSDARFWFPCYDQPWEKATAEINVTVSSGYVAASNGKFLGTTNNLDGTLTWRWLQSQPIATHLVCMTVSRFSVSSLPYIKSTGDTIPLQYYSWNAVPFVDSAWTAAFLPTVRQMVSAYAGLFGEYPFDKYGMTAIVPFGYLGMEHQTITTMNRYYATSHWVVSHELAHQWWGDNVTCGTWADIWLNESFATYCEALWREHLYGFDSLKAYMRDTLSQFQFVSWQGAIYDPVGQGFDLFTRAVYSKGGWVLHTLRGVVGDSVFFKSLRAYQAKYAGKSAITSELQNVVDSVAGRDMSWFFNQWIFGKGWPKYATRFTWNADTLTYTVQQNQEAAWPIFKMPIRVRAYFGANTRDYIVHDSLRLQTFKLPLSTQPDSVIFDPDGWILKQMVSFTDVVEEIRRPYVFQLEQNYPNPFNPSTTIRFEIAGLPDERGGSGSSISLTTRFVSLKVFDMLGREVATLVNDELKPGRHERVFSGTGISSGVYVYRLSAGGSTLTRKMCLIR